MELKEKLEEKVLYERNANKERPQSCLKNGMSSPKKARVAFAKDLVKIRYIPRTKSEDFSELENSDMKFEENTSVHREQFETPPKMTMYQRSLRGYLNEKRAQMNKLSSVSFDNQYSDYFREHSIRIAQQMMKD